MPPRRRMPEVEVSIQVEGRHPFFPRGMVRKPKGSFQAGEVVVVKNKEGRYLGQAFYNPRSVAMALRMLTWRKEDLVDIEFLSQRLERAIALRHKDLRLDRITNAYRLVHGEGDGLPGLVVDKFGRILVLELRALGMQHFVEGLGRRLRRLIPNDGMILTVHQPSRRKEGLDPGPLPPKELEVEIKEGKARFLVRPGQDHKTGFFCDQRDNRHLVQRLAKGRHVLDVCCYTGGFAINAALGGATTVTGVDLDEHAIGQARRNVRLNDAKVKLHQADAFGWLKEMAAKGKTWDLVILDPPAFARDKAGRKEALAKYRDLNRLGLQVVSPGGLMLTCSCSGPTSMEDMERIVQHAAGRFGGLVRILGYGGAGVDHPVSLHCPETRYLKSMLVQKEG